MSEEELEAIIAERFTEWAVELSRAHATPALLVGVGHGDNSGEIQILLPEGITAEWASRVLERCIEKLKAGDYWRP